MTQLNSRIKQIIAEECFLYPGVVTPTALFADLGVDSLAQIQIWMRIGMEFEVEIPQPDSDFWAHHPVQNLHDVLAVVQEMKQIAQSAPAAIAAGAGD